MFTIPEQFIVENFKKMPMWVRIITYFAILIVVLYGYISPKYLDGIAYIKLDKSSKEQYMKNTPYCIRGYGRSIKLTTSEDGIMSIPLHSIFYTKPIEIHIFPNGYDNNPNKVKIPVRKILSRDFTITYIEEDDEIILASAERNMQPKVAFDFNFIKLANADSSDEHIRIESIKEYVFQSVAKIAKKDISDITYTTVIKDLSMSQARLSYLYAHIEDKFKVVIWSEIWNETVTVNDLIKVMYIATNPETLEMFKTSEAVKIVNIKKPKVVNKPTEAVKPVNATEPTVVEKPTGGDKIVNVKKPKVLVKSSKAIGPSVFKTWQKTELPNKSE